MSPGGRSKRRRRSSVTKACTGSMRSFTFGGTGFTPIVNWPEVAILGVSRSQMKPLWDPGKEAFVPRLVMPFSLTYDHRLIDGADAARFCRHLAGILEDPLGLALA